MKQTKTATSAIASATDTLKQGGVIAYPTEAVWGLGCDPYNEAAFQRMLALKQRPAEKGVILVAFEVNQLGSLLDLLDSSQLAQLQRSQDEPTTWLIPADDSIPEWIRGKFQTVAVRVSSHPVVRNLCEAFGGMIVSTSANYSGEEPARSLEQAQNLFGSEVTYVPGDLGGALRPSRIIDLCTGEQLR